jgi:hypothetical protein
MKMEQTECSETSAYIIQIPRRKHTVFRTWQTFEIRKNSYICPFNYICMPYQVMGLGRAECNKTVANRNAGKSFKTLTLGSWTSAGFHTTYFLNAN